MTDPRPAPYCTAAPSARLARTPSLWRAMTRDTTHTERACLSWRQEGPTPKHGEALYSYYPSVHPLAYRAPPPTPTPSPTPHSNPSLSPARCSCAGLSAAAGIPAAAGVPAAAAGAAAAGAAGEGDGPAGPAAAAAAGPAAAAARAAARAAGEGEACEGAPHTMGCITACTTQHARSHARSHALAPTHSHPPPPATIQRPHHTPPHPHTPYSPSHHSCPRRRRLRRN